MSAHEMEGRAVARQRMLRGWSQAALSRVAGVPRTTVSAIEGGRLTPSVAAALALARALECSVEELFGGGRSGAEPGAPQWAWAPRTVPCRYWEAEVHDRRLLFPVEALAVNAAPHDGVWRGDAGALSDRTSAGPTLVAATCDPAAGLLAGEYARATGFRLLVLPRGSGAALDLLKRGLVHVAGLHCATPEQPDRNLETVRARLGGGFRLARVAGWSEGLALPAGARSTSSGAIVRSARRWALREAGSAARECLDSLRSKAPGRVVYSHAAVAEAVRGGWADAGVCVRLAAEEAGLGFLPVRIEQLDFCFAQGTRNDPRIRALLRVLRSRSCRRLIGDLPGYDARLTGEIFEVG